MSDTSGEPLSGPDLKTVGAASSELRDGGMLLGHFNGEPVLLVRKGTAVHAMGAKCTHYGGPLGEGEREGARVAWCSAPGSYASHVLVDAESAVPLPDGIDARTAAALMLQGLTAHYLARSTFALERGHVALVHAAAGGVGLLLVQLAKAAGAQVIGTVSTAEKAELAKGAGADEVILYSQTDFLEQTRRLADVLRSRADQAVVGVLLERMRAPPGDAPGGEDRRAEVRGDVEGVVHHRGEVVHVDGQ